MTDADSIPNLPRMWIGYTLAVLGFLVGIAEVTVASINNPGMLDGEEEFVGFYLLFSLAVWFYWLYCVYKFHEVMDCIPGYNHPIAPSRAVAMHFIPVYNLYWTFKWASEIATFVNWRMQASKMKGGNVGGLVLLAVLVGRFVDGSIGAVFLFSAGVYISKRLREALNSPPVPESAMAPAIQGPLGL